MWWTSAVLLVPAIYFMASRGHYTIMDDVDLFVHEMGHLVFAPFGMPLRMAGGTLLQLIVPLALAIYAFSYSYRLASQLFTFWFGHSLINVSVYVADAQAQSLPLVSLAGGGNTLHDWNWMLGGLGLLEYDAAIGIVFWLCGGAAFAWAISIPTRLI